MARGTSYRYVHQYKNRIQFTSLIKDLSVRLYLYVVPLCANHTPPYYLIHKSHAWSDPQGNICDLGRLIHSEIHLSMGR